MYLTELTFFRVSYFVILLLGSRHDKFAATVLLSLKTHSENQLEASLASLLPLAALHPLFFQAIMRQPTIEDGPSLASAFLFVPQRRPQRWRSLDLLLPILSNSSSGRRRVTRLSPEVHQLHQLFRGHLPHYTQLIARRGIALSVVAVDFKPL